MQNERGWWQASASSLAHDVLKEAKADQAISKPVAYTAAVATFLMAGGVSLYLKLTGDAARTSS